MGKPRRDGHAFGTTITTFAGFTRASARRLRWKRALRITSGNCRNCWPKRQGDKLRIAMADEERFLEYGDMPCSLTWQWGRDNPDGTRIDRYIGSDGVLYERIIPKGGPLCPEF